jgi:hypothetical protein
MTYFESAKIKLFFYVTKKDFFVKSDFDLLFHKNKAFRTAKIIDFKTAKPIENLIFSKKTVFRTRFF